METQVYFVCVAIVCSEGGPIRGSTINPTKSSMRALSAGIFDAYLDARPGPELRMLANHIAQYTSRQLTYERDILDAFRGLLARSGFLTYFGIPISAHDNLDSMDLCNMNLASEKDATIGFARGLYWVTRPSPFHQINAAPLARREQFPSWSWAGWIGKVYYPSSMLYGDSEHGLISCDVLTFSTEIWVEGGSKELITLSELIATSDTRLLPEISAYIHIEIWTIQV